MILEKKRLALWIGGLRKSSVRKRMRIGNFWLNGSHGSLKTSGKLTQVDVKSTNSSNKRTCPYQFLWTFIHDSKNEIRFVDSQENNICRYTLRPFLIFIFMIVFFSPSEKSLKSGNWSFFFLLFFICFTILVF